MPASLRREGRKRGGRFDWIAQFERTRDSFGLNDFKIPSPCLLDPASAVYYIMPPTMPDMPEQAPSTIQTSRHLPHPPPHRRPPAWWQHHDHVSQHIPELVDTCGPGFHHEIENVHARAAVKVLLLDFGVVLRLTRVHRGFVRYFLLCTVSLLQYFSCHFLCWCNTHQIVLIMPPTHVAGAYLATVSHQREVGRVLMFVYWT